MVAQRLRDAANAGPAWSFITSLTTFNGFHPLICMRTVGSDPAGLARRSESHQVTDGSSVVSTGRGWLSVSLATHPNSLQGVPLQGGQVGFRLSHSQFVLGPDSSAEDL